MLLLSRGNCINAAAHWGWCTLYLNMLLLSLSHCSVQQRDSPVAITFVSISEVIGIFIDHIQSSLNPRSHGVTTDTLPSLLHRLFAPGLTSCYSCPEWCWCLQPQALTHVQSYCHHNPSSCHFKNSVAMHCKCWTVRLSSDFPISQIITCSIDSPGPSRCLYDSAAHPSLAPYHPCSIVHYSHTLQSIHDALCCCLPVFEPFSQTNESAPACLPASFSLLPVDSHVLPFGLFILTTNPWTVPV